MAADHRRLKAGWRFGSGWIERGRDFERSSRMLRSGALF
jgi:hypothetical protein